MSGRRGFSPVVTAHARARFLERYGWDIGGDRALAWMLAYRARSGGYGLVDRQGAIVDAEVMVGLGAERRRVRFVYCLESDTFITFLPPVENKADRDDRADFLRGRGAVAARKKARRGGG